MAVTSMQWDGIPPDIHLVAGGSVDLGAALWLFTDSPTSTQRGNAFSHAGSALTFFPLLKDTGGVAGEVRNAGITVNTRTGVVSLAAPLIDGFKPNFIVEARVAQGTAIVPAFVRIHVHPNITALWLTPAELRVMRTEPAASVNTTLRKFAVRASFDDGIVADISGHESILSLNWTAGTSPNGTIRIPGGTIAGQGFDVTIERGGLRNTARAAVVDHWANGVRAKLVPGGAADISTATADKFNFVFLSEGFATGEGTKFEQYAAALVAFLADPLMAPYGALRQNITFWSAFIAQLDPGVSIGGEVHSYAEGAGVHTLRFVPHPVRPLDTYTATQTWTLPQLIYMVGLPMPDDAEGTGRTDQQIMDAWRAWLPQDPTPHLGTFDFLFIHLGHDLLVSWRKLAKRGMVDAVDSALGLKVGSQNFGGEGLVTIDPDRMERTGASGIDGILDGLTSSAGAPLTGFWAPGDDTGPRSNMMVAILSSAPGRAVNETRNKFFHLNEHGFWWDLEGTLFQEMRGGALRDIPGRFVLRAKAAVDPALAEHDTIVDKSRTFAHELSHSFKIGDEYSEYPSDLPSIRTIDPFYSNLQREQELLSAGRIDGEKIKWRWHRILKAAEIAGAITNSGADEVSVPLKPGQAAAFRTDDIVILRERSIRTPLQAVPLLSDPMKVLAGSTADLLKLGNPHIAFPYRAGVNTIAISAVSTHRRTPTDPLSFAAGAVVYQPKPAHASQASLSYPYAEVLPKTVMDEISLRHAALTTRTFEQTYPQPPPTVEPEQEPDLSRIALPDCFNRNRPRVVGLYTGGARYFGKVYHPTGHCIMRTDNESGREFCHVCRYLIVEAIDPSHHGVIDRAYDAAYPIRS